MTEDNESKEDTLTCPNCGAELTKMFEDEFKMVCICHNCHMMWIFIKE